jgi:hypothetical protein
VSKSSRRSSRGAGGSPPAGADATRPTSTQSPASGGGRPASARAGRRERPRYGYADRSFTERHRTAILTAAALAVTVLVGSVVFLNATAKAYTCGEIWQPEPTASPGPDESPRLGYLQPNMGRDHNVDRPESYRHCPPASGNHFNVQGLGPIEARVYRPDDGIEPMSWIHNLEHGGLVILYRCEGGDGCTDEGQSRMREFFSTFPNSPICDFPRGTVGPVMARFEDMAWPYAALVWGRVLPLETFDAEQILQFFNTEAERTNPELLGGCQRPSPSPSAAPSGSVAPSAAPSAPGSAPASTPPSAPASASPAAPTSPSAGPS